MAPLPVPRSHGHRRGPTRSQTFMALSALTLLTLCLVTLHLHQLPTIPSFGPAAAPAPADSESRQAGMASSSLSDRVNQDFLEILLDLAAKERDRQAAHVPMEYAANKRPSFRDDPPRMVDNLPRKHIPRGASSAQPPSKGRTSTGRRLVFVGDVHGHLETLKALLKKIGFDNHKGDHLVLAGDIVTKGPDSRGVVKLAMELGASAVRGNQDDRVLAVAREMRRLGVEDVEEDDGEDGDDGDANDLDDDESDERFDVETRRNVRLRKVARSLSRAQLAWLRSLPLILRIGPIPDATAAPWNASTIAVVHGGLVPGVPLEKQDPWAVMNMRSLVYPREAKNWRFSGVWSNGNDEAEERDDDGDDKSESSEDSVVDTSIAIPVDGRKGEPWSHAWNRHQNNLPSTSPRTVAIYGHDARSGLQVDTEVDISPYSPRRKKKHNKKKNKKTKEHSPLRSNISISPNPNYPGDETDHTYHHVVDDDGDLSSTPSLGTNKKKEKGLRYAFGLDSGCGHGRQLTALILEADPSGEGGIKHRIEQAECVEKGKKGKGRSKDLR
ncbi:hypothetical protein VTJ49DRAFT_2411 [Mycothermus thermophilus]|uniref:Calcineurin-like phosphoesterase domain-containing protein n=1 Tax=Humicola insolens TaxID=85995 RepID=A0ABR3VA85_HUMIN